MKKSAILIVLSFLAVNLFSQSLFEAATTATPKQAKSNLSLNGFFRSSVFGGGESYDLTTTFAEISFQPQYNAGKAFIKSDLRLRTGMFFDEKEHKVILKELYGGYKADAFDLFAGYQIINWGRTDGFNPTNNITPNDYFFLTANPNDQKLSNLMLRMKYRIKSDIELELIGIPYFSPSVYRYELFDMGDNVSFVKNAFTDRSLKNGALAARLNFDLPAIGWSLSYFRGHDPYHGFDVQTVDWTSGAPLITNTPMNYHKSTFGADFALPLGEWIVRGEAAYNLTDNPGNKMYIPASDIAYVLNVEKTFAGVMVIGQYIGKFTPDFNALTTPVLNIPSNRLEQLQYAIAMIDFENRLFNRRIFNQQEQANHAASLTLSKSFGYDAWNVECTAYYNFTSDELMIRPSILWKISDALSATAGANYMLGADKTLFGYSSKVMNGLFAELRVKF